VSGPYNPVLRLPGDYNFQQGNGQEIKMRKNVWRDKGFDVQLKSAACFCTLLSGLRRKKLFI
jgi:hypothetical protein